MGKGDKRLMPEGVYTNPNVKRPRYLAKLNIRPGCGLLPDQAFRTAAEASTVIRQAKLRALLGGATDRLSGTEAACYAVLVAACNLQRNLSSEALAGLRKCAATALQIDLKGTPTFRPTIRISWGDVWATATGVLEFGLAVEEQAVDVETREVRRDVVVRVGDAVRIGLWNSPVGQTLKTRPQQCRVVPVAAVEVDSGFLTAGVALDWAVHRLLKDARRLHEILQDCTSADDLASLLKLNPMTAEDAAAAGHDASTALVWKMYSQARTDAAAAAMTASGKLDFKRAPCLAQLIDGSAPDSRSFKHDLRFDLAVVLEELSRRLGSHAKDLFAIETLGALCTFAKPESRRSFKGVLQSMARQHPGPRSKCAVIRARTLRGEPGLKCPAESCDACHRAAGISDTIHPHDVTPGMVALSLGPTEDSL